MTPWPPFNGNVKRCIYDERIRAKRLSKLYLGEHRSGVAQFIGDVLEDFAQ